MGWQCTDRGGGGPEHNIRRRPGCGFASRQRAARRALRLALLDLRRDAQHRAEHQWRRHKGPMACYWRAVGVYAGHIARALR